jgi:hypothetical protein
LWLSWQRLRFGFAFGFAFAFAGIRVMLLVR